jgi:putative transposase
LPVSTSASWTSTPAACTRDIAAHVTGLYGVQIGRDTISRVTDAVLEDIADWRGRPLEAVCPIVYFDALHVKVTEDRSVRSRACYFAVGVTCEGDREALGIWWQETEGAKFWLAVLNEPRPARRQRRPDRLPRRAHRAARSDRGGVPAGVGADLHRPPHPQLDALRRLPGPQASRARPQTRLRRG